VLSDQARVLQYQVDKSVAEIHERELETLAKLAKAGEFRDETTGNHLMRMAKYSALIGAHLGLGSETVHVLEVAAPMHDIGKIGIPDSVLLKEGPLTRSEIEIMKTHPRKGYDILKGSPSKYLSMGAIIALGHHEKFDGSAIPMVCTAKTFRWLPAWWPWRTCSMRWSASVLTSTRGTWTRASNFLKGQRGKHFDPTCIDAFLGDRIKIQGIIEEFGD